MMTRTCPPDDTLSALVDDALPSGAREALLSHAIRCSHCTARLAELRALHDAFLALPPAPLQVDLGARIIARLQAVDCPSQQANRGTRWWAALIALVRPVSSWRSPVLPYVGTTAALGLGLWLGGMLLQVEDPASPPSPNVTLAAMSLFDSIPPGNLCPRADTCSPTGSAR